MFSRGIKPEEYFLTDAMFINAIAFSNHHPDRIRAFVGRKMTHLHMIEKAAEGAHQEWKSFAQTVDRDQTMICPLVRAVRLKTYLAKIYEVPLDLDELDKIEAYLLDAKARGACSHEMTAPIDDIVFEAVDVDVLALAAKYSEETQP